MVFFKGYRVILHQSYSCLIGQTPRIGVWLVAETIENKKDIKVVSLVFRNEIEYKMELRICFYYF